MNVFVPSADRSKNARWHGIQSFWFILLTLLLAPLAAAAQSTNNPVVSALAADPYIITQNNTYYFLATHSPNVEIKAASSIDGLSSAPWVSVYTPSGFPQSLGLWYFPQYNSSQPWYILYQNANSGNGELLQSDSTNPLGSYHMANSNVCGYGCGDPGFLYWNNALYLLGTDLSTIYLTPMSDPANTSGSRSGILFKRPPPADYSTDWEWIGNDQFGCCFEGPFPWAHNGQLSITFSGNRWQTNEYATGIAKYNGGDILSPSSWQELDTASNQWFGGSRGSGNGVWGAAATRGFTAPGDPGDVWMVYHAYPQYCEFCSDNRQAYVQPVSWTSDNLPSFNGGTPLGNQSVRLPAGDPGVGSVSPVSGSTYTLVSQLSSSGNQVCLDDSGGGTSPGTNVQIWTCNSLAPQNWKLQDAGNGYFELINQQNGLCLDDAGGGTDPGTNVQQWSCLNLDTQYWKFISVGTSVYKLINQHSGLALDVSGGNSAPGTNVQLYTDLNNTPQSWLLQQR